LKAGEDSARGRRKKKKKIGRKKKTLPPYIPTLPVMTLLPIGNFNKFSY